MRTTINIADPVLADVKEIQTREGKALGEVVSELLAEGLAARLRGRPRRRLRWTARDLGARVDLRDQQALWAAFDRETLGRS